MKTEVIFLAIFVAVVAGAANEGYYKLRFDELNLNEVLPNYRLVKSYYKCIVGAGRCTKEGKELKKVFPEMLQTKCQRCSPIQKKRLKKIVTYLMANYPDIWDGLVRKFDPTGELTKDMLTDPNFLGKVDRRYPTVLRTKFNTNSHQIGVTTPEEMTTSPEPVTTHEAMTTREPVTSPKPVTTSERTTTSERMTTPQRTTTTERMTTSQRTTTTERMTTSQRTTTTRLNEWTITKKSLLASLFGVNFNFTIRI